MERKRSKKTRTSRRMEDLLAEYGEILNTDGAESRREREFLDKFRGDEAVLRFLRGARAVKAMFEAFGDFPEDLLEEPDKSEQPSKSR